MSHVVEVELETKLTNIELIKEAAKELNLKCWEELNYVFPYDKTKASGILVQLPGWKYPIVVEKDGQIKADNYNGDWGKPIELEKFEHEYKSLHALSEVKAKLDKAKMKYTVKKEAGKYVVEA
jgi:signal recognition particle subunit SEC65